MIEENENEKGFKIERLYHSRDIDEEKRMRMRRDSRLRDYIIPEILMKRRE